MPPRLAHKKTRTGCKRCKARKVKCDEERPKCGACTRHSVDCEYPSSPYGDHSSPGANGAAFSQADQLLELRLMHEWTAYTCNSLSTTWEFWKLQVPIIALRHRHVMDGLLALAALHVSRQKARYWSTLEGRMIDLPDGEDGTGPFATEHIESGWKSTTESRKAILGQPLPESVKAMPTTPETRLEMLEISRRYFASALEGHQRAVANLSAGNFQPTYLSSIMVCYYSLFTLSEGSGQEDESESLMLDPMKWFRLSRGTQLIIDQWSAQVGKRWFVEAGGMYGEPDLSDSDELFRAEHREPFRYLLDPVNGDTIAAEDREAYEHALSYIGLIYKGIVHSLDSPLAIGRRVIAMPVRVPPRFGTLVETHQPRALAILAHTFATMKLAEEKFPWFKGIAERQVPKVCMAVPESWSAMIQWPLEIIRASLSNLQHMST